jgi:hypothetical protein
MTNPLAVAVKGKGFSALFNRARAISRRYGFTSAKVDRALKLFTEVLGTYECGASFPITASVLRRSAHILEKYPAHDIEFAIHGLLHVDYSQLSLDEQDSHIQRARQIFSKTKIGVTGFRCPYLRWNADTLAAAANQSLSYDGSQALYWNVEENYLTEAYRHVLEFYRAKSANDYPALPRITRNVVQIPYCLPDDEALIERMKLSDTQAMSEIWLAMLGQTYELGELFTLGLHPERIGLLHKPLANTLAKARSLSPSVWIARLDEIAGWWRAREHSGTRRAVARWF